MTARFSFRQVLFLFLITIIGVICSVVFQEPLVIGFFPGYFVLFLLSLKNKLSIKKAVKISLVGIHKTSIVITILFLVSFLLPSWYLSGTIELMVKVALNFISPQHFFVLSFLAAMILSMLLGTTVGTLSSIAVPILGTAAVLHLPLEIAAGALVSGAFVGDRTSPFSSAHQLLSHTVEVPVKHQWKAMMFTTVMAILTCVSFYGFFDWTASNQDARNFRPIVWVELSIVKFIPPSVLLAFVIFRIRIIYAFLASILSAAAIALINGVTFSRLADALWNGIDGLGGGFNHMYELLLFLGLAGAYNALVEELNVIQPYLDKWLETSKSLSGDTLKILVATLVITLIAANQTLPIILTGRSFLPHWSQKYGKSELARVMGDTTMLFPGVVPWSVLAIMCSTIIGLPLLSYLPYAIFLWSLPFLTIFVSVGKQIRKTKLNNTVSI